MKRVFVVPPTLGITQYRCDDETIGLLALHLCRLKFSLFSSPTVLTGSLPFGLYHRIMAMWFSASHRRV